MISPISSTNYSPSMKGAYNTMVEGSANLMGRIANLKISQSEAQRLGKNKHASNIISNIASAVLTLCLLYDIARSKDIAKENKPYLLINTALVTIVAAVASMMIDSATDAPVEDLKKGFMATNFKFNKAQIKEVVDNTEEFRRTGDIMDDPVHAHIKNHYGFSSDKIRDIFDGAKKLKAEREQAIKCTFSLDGKTGDKKIRHILNEYMDFVENGKMPEHTIMDFDKTKTLFEKMKTSDSKSSTISKLGIDFKDFENIDRYRHQMKLLDDFSRGVSKVKSNSIFSFVVRFGIPLLSVPVTTWILDLFKNSKQDEKISYNA